MNKKCSEFISWAKDNEWDIIVKSEAELKLNDSLTSRYKQIPESYIEFLKIIKQCFTPNEKTWFICEDEYNNNSDIAFKWNEFEILSLEAAEKDKGWKTEITSWWNKYGVSVKYKDGYPDFKETGLVKQEVDIGEFKNYNSDFKRADELTSKPRDAINNTWHHLQDGRTMQEIDKGIHKGFTHRGGMSLKNKI
jgi:hypothetical protein